MEKQAQERGKLICSNCRRPVDKLFSAPWTATIPGGRVVHEGDLICELCLRDLRKAFTDEQTFTRPPE